MKVATGPEVNVEQLMQSIRDELAGRRHYRAAPLRRDRLFLPEPVIPPAQSPLHAHNGDSYRLRDFLEYEGPDFVHAAYRGILTREADASGFDGYSDQLRRGVSKVAVLGRIRYSPEGRRRGTKVRGLTAPFILDWISGWPVVGRIVGIAVSIWNGPVTERSYRRLASEFAYWREQSEQDSLRTTKYIHEALRTLEQSQNLTSDLAQAHADTRLEAVRQTLADAIGSLSELQASVAHKIDRELFEAKVGEVAADLNELKQVLFNAVETNREPPVP